MDKEDIRTKDFLQIEAFELRTAKSEATTHPIAPQAIVCIFGKKLTGVIFVLALRSLQELTLLEAAE